MQLHMAWPDASVDLPRYGRPGMPGLSQSCFRLCPGLQAPPARACLLER